MTAISGGLLRDVLAGRQNLLMAKELYAIPVTLGCAGYVLLATFFPFSALVHMIISFALSFGLRVPAN